MGCGLLTDSLGQQGSSGGAVTGDIVGLGGADITLDQMNEVFTELEQRVQGTYDGSIKYLGIEE